MQERTRRRLLARGETTVASVGIAAAAILLAAMAASGWWTVRVSSEAATEARVKEVRSVGELLSRTIASMLGANELSAVRRIVAETAHNYGFDTCRIVLEPGRVLADANPSRINQKELPAHWTAGPAEDRPASNPAGALSLRYPVLVPGRGGACLEIGASVVSVRGAYWEAQTGAGLIGAAALTALLFAYRRSRSSCAAIEAVQTSLLAFEAEEHATTLTVDPAAGAVARAWNQVLAEMEKLRQQALAGRAAAGIGARRGTVTGLEAGCDAMSQGLVLVDDRLRVRFANGAAAVLLSQPRETMVGRTIEDLVADQVLSPIRAVADGSARRAITIEIERSGESSGVLRFSVRPVRKDDAAAAMLIIEDVTQLRIAERSRNSFVAQVTHELRTPLTNIRLYTETAIEHGDSNPAVRANCLNVINNETRRLERIVSEMLSVAEIEAGSFTVRKGDVYLEALFKDLQADYQGQADAKKIAMEFVMPPKLPRLHADKDKLAVALHNLVGNALKYTPEGGKVSISAAARDGRVAVEITDTGIGIRPEELEQVFECFYRSKDPRIAKIVGTGLGLTLAREVVRLHGGDLTVESELDRGSTFTLSIPLIAEAA